MSGKANIGSIETLEIFRSSLIIFRTKARNRLDEVSDAVRRTQGWITHEQRLHWQTELRKRRDKLDRAEQELMSARLSSLRQNLSGQTMAVQKAKAALREAEDKMRAVMAWSRNFEAQAAPMLRRMESLRGVLEHDIPKAVALLTRTQNLLADYAAGSPHSLDNSAAPDTTEPDQQNTGEPTP